MATLRATDVDGTWQYIARGVDIIMAEDLTGGWLTPEAYMHMYTAIHNFCVASPPASSRTQPLGSGRTQHTQLQGGEVYKRLSDYLRAHLASLLASAPAAPGPDLIAYYNRTWSRYTLGAKYLDHIFSYLNRHWVKHEGEEGGRSRGVYEVNTLCLILLRDHFFIPLSQNLIASLLDQIEIQRNGGQVDVDGLKIAIQSLVSIGIDDQSNKRTSLTLYVKTFEIPYIEATAAYYTRESAIYLEHHGVVPYMSQVDRRLQEEQQRTAMILHPSTESKVVDTCERVLIESSAGAIQGEFLGLLAADRQKDVHVLFRLLSKVPNGLNPIQEMLTSYVKEQGLSAVNQLVSGTEGGSPDARAYVETLLNVYDHFASLVHTAFEDSVGISKAIELGCEAFINKNALAKKKSTSGRIGESRTPELLAKFADSLLKKSSKNAEFDDIEKSLQGIIRILKFVDEKDIFENNYSRLLSRRLVHQNSANQELEASMVSRLGDLCGFEYTNKLQRMFQDMMTSTEMQQQFRKQQDPSAPDFNSYVLAEAFWPLPYRDVPFEVPKPLVPAFDDFTRFYDQLHNGRKLKWLWNFGKAEIKVNFTKSRAGYILQVSAYQMAILLAFNDTDTLTIEQLAEITKLPSELLSGSLTYIVKAQVLHMSPKDATIGDPTTSYSLNMDYKSKKVRINLNLPLKTETKQEDTDQQIEEDRKMFLQAVMVRIMKARREVSHAQLVQETMQMARKRFQPSVKDIKRCITVLVEKEYLQRIEDDRYQYLA